jgi:sugar transferase EpsL
MYGLVKRVIDIIGAASGLILTAPFMPLIAALIRCSMGSPVLFRQKRVGFREKPFWCLKFRTMTSTCDKQGRLLPDKYRYSSLGTLLRRTSLDELPQLWNILKGDMSFVGPRPLYGEYIPYYTPEERKRHSVRPGLTGWAQIHGRNILPFDDRLAMDVWYVNHMSWSLDVAILLKTVWVVFAQHGSAADPSAQSVPLHVLRAGPEAVSEFLGREP